MTVFVEWLCAAIIMLATAFGAYYIGTMQGRAHGFEQCLGQQDEEELSRKVWRASR